MDLKLKKKVILITGASSGIGRSTALLMGEEKCRIALMARNETRLETVAEQIKEVGGEALVVRGDVTNESHCKNIMSKIIQYFGHLDGLVNAAGILETGTIESTSLENWDRMMAINLRAVFYMIQLATPHLIRTKGAIVNISSVNGYRSFPGVLAYNVSKAGVDQLTRCVALELADKGVRVNSINPGVTITELHRRGGMDEEKYKIFLDHSFTTHPLAKGLNRLAQPEDISRLVLYLISPHGEWITGANYLVDGGRGQTCFR